MDFKLKDMAIIVKAKKDEDIRSLLMRFRKQVLKDDIVEELRERRFYKKPSTVRKERETALRRRPGRKQW